MILQAYKIVFGGTMGAGKSAAIQNLSEVSVVSTEAVSTDGQINEKLLTTVGIDYGEITLENGTKIGLYGTPGQDRFNFMWSIVCKGALGTVILIDHTREERLEDLAFYIQEFRLYGENIFIGITHLDQDNTDQIIQSYIDWLHTQNLTYPVVALDARKKQDVLSVIEKLLETSQVELSIE